MARILKNQWKHLCWLVDSDFNQDIYWLKKQMPLPSCYPRLYDLDLESDLHTILTWSIFMSRHLKILPGYAEIILGRQETQSQGIRGLKQDLGQWVIPSTIFFPVILKSFQGLQGYSYNHVISDGQLRLWHWTKLDKSKFLYILSMWWTFVALFQNSFADLYS